MNYLPTFSEKIKQAIITCIVGFIIACGLTSCASKSDSSQELNTDPYGGWQEYNLEQIVEVAARYVDVIVYQFANGMENTKSSTNLDFRRTKEKNSL